MAAANIYSGLTTVAAGTLELAPAAQNCVLTGGANIQAGKIVFDYAGAADPATTIQSLLAASYHGGLWDVGQFRDSTAAATGLTLGCFDDTSSSTVTVMATYPGDFNLDGVVDNLDRSIWFANAFTGTTWQQGDANYDGAVNGLDRDLWFANAGLPPIAGSAPNGPNIVGAPAPSRERWRCWPSACSDWRPVLGGGGGSQGCLGKRPVIRACLAVPSNRTRHESDTKRADRSLA